MATTVSPARRASRVGTVSGILTLLVGVFALAAPFASGLATAMTFGFLLIMAGSAQLVFAFGEKSFGEGLLSFLLGAITIVGGALMVARPMVGLASLTLVALIWLMADAIWCFMAYFQLKGIPGRGWHLASGALSLILFGLVYKDYPDSAMWLIGTVVGVKLVMSGTSMLMLSSAARKLSA